jgi:hypothetical protein
MIMMKDIEMSGWNLPPGCSVRDLPGAGPNAYEVAIDGTHYAWDEDDRVYMYTGEHRDEYDDGYRLLGTLAWDDDNPEQTLRDWIVSLSSNKN